MKRLLAIAVLAPSAALAQTTAAKNGVREPGVRKSAFSVGVSGLRHSLKAGDGNEVLGNAGAVNLGAAYISEAWYAAASLDILLGPYEPTRGGQLNVDHVGTGITLWSGFSAQTMNLRSQEGGYGFALGLSYADSVGRSIGKNRREKAGNPKENADLVDNYVIRVNNLSVLPAIFFSWLTPPRPRGNTPELLTTRLEGYFLTIGAAMPLVVTYSARYETRGWSDPASGEPPIATTTKTENGQLRGYSILMTFTALMGT